MFMPKQITTKIYDTIKAQEFYVPIFNQYYYLIFGKSDWQKLCAADPDFATYSHDGDNNGMVAANTDTNRIYVWFKDTSVIELGTLAHECVHLAKRILDCRGVKQQDEETIAHLVGYLYTQLKPYFKQ